MKKVEIPPKDLNTLYLHEKLSTRKISSLLKIDLKTVLKLMKFHKIPSRTLAESWEIRKKQIYPRNLVGKLILDYSNNFISIAETAIKNGINRKKASVILRANSISIRSKSLVLMGKQKTSEHRAHISAGRSKMLANSPELISKLRKHRLNQILPTKDTSIERAIEDELSNREIGHYKHFAILGRCQADKAFPDIKLAIFLDGDYWHRRKDVLEKDERINNLLRDKGWTVLRFWEAEIKRDPKSIVDKIEAKINVLRGVNYGFPSPKME